MKTTVESKRKHVEVETDIIFESVEHDAGSKRQKKDSSSPIFVKHTLLNKATPSKEGQNAEKAKKAKKSEKIKKCEKNKKPRKSKKPKKSKETPSSAAYQDRSTEPEAEEVAPSRPDHRRLLGFICKHSLGEEIALSDPELYIPPDSDNDTVRDILSVSRPFCKACEDLSLTHAVRGVLIEDWRPVAAKLAGEWRLRGQHRPVNTQHLCTSQLGWRLEARGELQEFVAAFGWQALYNSMYHDIDLWHVG